MTNQIDVDYARKNEGYIYGDGAADLALAVGSAASKYVTAKGQATAAYKALCKFAKGAGLNPDREVFMRPENNGWRVSFEAGPYQWAIVASEALCQAGIFAEPYYSFDLCFYN